MRIPIYYMNGEKDSYEFFMGYRDDYIKYDEYGDPIFLGAYFKRMWEKKYTIKTTKENLPEEIWEGILEISESIFNPPSEPLVQLYKGDTFALKNRAVIHLLRDRKVAGVEIIVVT